MANVQGKRKGGATGGQIAECNRFTQASRWAIKTIADPDEYAFYVSKAKKKMNAYNTAMTDFLNPPKVTAIDVSRSSGNPGEEIVVTASDDFCIKQVMFEIHAPSGDVLEQGPCRPDERGFIWAYTTTTAISAVPGITVRAIATDKPGHKGELTVPWKA